MPSAAEECREPSWKCQGISHCLESGHPVMCSGKLDSNVTLCTGLQSCGKVFSASYLLSLLMSVHNLIICLPAALIDLEGYDQKLPKFTEC